ncbi:hypothetical protein OG462_09015 [Streptomyces sp. NBC_01077]|uniref:hypothetical protein n=1 Tax=Streptomyces sp. NBC_01077 TaxID=2903746 RepID=UPI0038638219|nr:hypothetical protein OG462_09015 [Streptomyces sp. NBC_01077]
MLTQPRDATAKASTRAVVRAECQVGEHTWCRLEEVRTPTAGILVFPAPRCDCACHKAVTR